MGTFFNFKWYNKKMENIFFSKILKKCREGKKLSQAKLAQLTGLQTAAISHFETGLRKPSFDNLRKLADALNVTTDYLLGREVQPTDADLIFRHSQNLSDEDKKLAENFMELLANKNK